MIVYHNNNQDIKLKELFKKHENVQQNKLKENIENLIRKLTLTIRESLSESKIIDPRIGRDGLLGSLRRIQWAYSKYIRVDISHNGHDDREILMVVFFHNAKCFLEIIRNLAGSALQADTGMFIPNILKINLI